VYTRHSFPTIVNHRLEKPLASNLDRKTGNAHGRAELLWTGREPPTRGPKPAHSLEHIAQIAVEIADAEGLAAVSMQRVAERLEFTKMAMYRYVASKAELYAVMIESAVGIPPDLTKVRGGWRPKLEAFARELAEAWRIHPWLPWATIGDRVMGPNEVGWIECAVSAFDGTGLNGAERLDAVFVVCGHIRNTQSMTTAGTQPWTTDKQLSPTMQGLLQDHRDRYPSLTATVGEASGAAHDNGRQLGMRLILDGLEVLIAERRPAAGPGRRRR
jgi:AcrR family transcriptional regulator